MEVFLIGESRQCEEGWQAYLKHINAPEWATDAPSEAEALTELYGRGCYKSFSTDLNKNLSRVRDGNAPYLANIQNSGHGSVCEHVMINFMICDVSRVFCYAPDTEILTYPGIWKNITELTLEDKLLTKDPTDSANDRWSDIKSLKQFRYEGNLHWFESSQWSSPAFTGDHIQWCARYDKRQCRGLSNSEIKGQFMEKIPYSDVQDKRIVIDHSIANNGCNTPWFVIGGNIYAAPQFMKWLGLVATDGHIVEDRYRISISQTKPKVRNVIRDLMDHLFKDRWREYDNAFVIHDQALHRWVIDMIGRLKSERTLWSLFQYHPRLLRQFLDGALLGDGNTHQENGHQVLYCPNESLAKDYQMLFAKVGQSTNIREDDRRGVEHLVNGVIVRNNLIGYIVSIHRKGESLVKKGHHCSKYYNGYVYCPETQDGLVFVRRKGMAFWSGNTHELVRHRAGTAISMESGRYVRRDHLGYDIPSCIMNNEAALRRYQRVMRYLDREKRLLDEDMGIDEEGLNFALKKEYSSATRRIFPHGEAVDIGWSANFRALRHTIEMRTSRHSEEEMRKVFAKVFELCIERYPNMFQDYSEDQVNGIIEISFRNSKI